MAFLCDLGPVSWIRRAPCAARARSASRGSRSSAHGARLIHCIAGQSNHLQPLRPCPDARERAGPVFPPPVGEEETQAQRASGQPASQFKHSSIF